VFGWPALVLLLAGLPIVLVAGTRSRWVWPLLLMVNIIGIGPRIKGYFFLDEVLTGLLVVGCLARRATIDSQGTEPKAEASTPPEGLHKIAFAAWIGYVVLQSVRGILVTGDVRLLRWVVMYCMLGIMSSLMVGRKRIAFPSLRDCSLVILGTTIVFYIVYLAQGMYWESVLPARDIFGALGRFQSQHFFWAGSAFSVFPTLIAIPAGLFVLNDKSRRVKTVAWAAILLMMVVALYYDSRTSWLVMGGYLAVAIRKLRLGYVIALLSLFVVLFMAFNPGGTGKVVDFVVGLLGEFEALWKTSDNLADVSRNLQMRAALNAALDSFSGWMFGSGYYSHRYILGPYIVDLYERFLPTLAFKVIEGSRNDPFAFTVFRTTALAALLVDTGVVGVALFGMNFVLTASCVMWTRSRERLILVMTVVMAFMWLLVSNILDIILLHLIIMPGGLVYRLAQASVRSSTGDDNLGPPLATKPRLAGVAR